MYLQILGMLHNMHMLMTVQAIRGQASDRRDICRRSDAAEGNSGTYDEPYATLNEAADYIFKNDPEL